MKINPIGINSYQQLTGQDASRKPSTEKKAEVSLAQSTVLITPKSEATSSRLAVKAEAGSYADFLSPEEKNALELLFSRYTDRGRFGPSYNRNATEQEDSARLGNVLDLKA